MVKFHTNLLVDNEIKSDFFLPSTANKLTVDN